MRTKEILKPVLFGILAAGTAAPAFCQSVDPSDYYDPLRPGISGAIQSALLADQDGNSTSFNSGLNLNNESPGNRVQFGLKRDEEFVVNSRAPLQMIWEDVASAGSVTAQLHRKVIGQADIVFEKMNERLADPAIAESVTSAWRDSILMTQARYLSDMHRREKYRNTKFEQLLGQTDEGCFARKLKEVSTYAEAQELCYQSNLNDPVAGSGFKKLPDGSEMVKFSDFPDRANTKDRIDWAANDPQKILMTDIIFNPEIIAHENGQPGDQGYTVTRRLREAWKALIGDYVWTMENTTGSVKLTSTRVAPTKSTKDGKTGFDGIQSVLFQQVYHGIYAMEYAHCLVAKGKGGSVFPATGGPDGQLQESEFFTRKGVGNPLNTKFWPETADWAEYKTEEVENEPLRLFKMRFPELAGSLSIGTSAATVPNAGFSFNGKFEGALWTLFRKNILADTLACDTLKSWKGTKIPRKDWTLRRQIEFDNDIIELASLISTAQVLGFLDQSLNLINKISNKVLDERMAGNARDMIMEFANYAPVTDYFIQAVNQTHAKATQLMQAAELERRGEGIAQGAQK